MSASLAIRRRASLAGPIAISVLLHGLVIAPFVLWKAAGSPPLPPMYRVDLVAAPPGEPAVGVVRETPPAAEPTTKAPPKAEMNQAEKVAPIKPPTKAVRPTTRATPNVTKAPEKVAVSKAPTAGGGEVGGPGTDVANVRTEGIDFPFPGYLANIVRQVRLQFKPRKQGLKAEVFFFIKRDGSISGFRFVKSSGDYEFDLEAEAAVEAAARSFGALPAGFSDDILPISFTFDPATLR